jgi:hypothetical protein
LDDLSVYSGQIAHSPLPSLRGMNIGPIVTAASP